MKLFLILALMLNLAAVLLVRAQTPPTPLSASDPRAIMVEPVAARAAAPIAAAPAPGNAALFVGVNQFAEDPSLRPLNFAVHDAIAQAHLFVMELRLIAPANCTLALAGSPTSENARRQLQALEKAGVNRINATKTAILKALLSLTQAAKDKTDLLVVSISSHGFEDRGVAYAMPADGLKGMLADSALSIASLEQQMARSTAGKRLLILDACRDNPLNESKGSGANAMSDSFRKALASAEGQAVLASCDAGQSSLENPQLGHGVFTYYLLEAMRGQAAADNRGFITLGAVSDYVAKGVSQWVSRNRPAIDHAARQQPWFKGPGVAREIPLAIDPGIHARRAQSQKEVAQVIEALKVRIDRKGAFDAGMYEKVAQALEQAGDDETGRKFVQCSREFADGKIDADLYVPYFKALPILAGKPSKVGDTITNSIGMVFTYIPAPVGGVTTIGSPRNEEGRNEDEDQRQVRINKPFLMGITEVTQKQWQAVMGTSVKEQRDKAVRSGSMKMKGEGDDYPMYYVSWDEAQEFCKKLSQKEGRRYRLPTEAEWEYACRAGSTGAYAGNLDEMAWYADNSGDRRFDSTKLWINKPDKFEYAYDLIVEYKCSPHPVSEKKPNAWGLYDMHGNVWEWCEDWYEVGKYRVLRGGGWYFNPLYCRSASRTRYTPDTRVKDFGFRLLLDLSE